jgi:hypothetical protein
MRRAGTAATQGKTPVKSLAATWVREGPRPNATPPARARPYLKGPLHSARRLRHRGGGTMPALPPLSRRRTLALMGIVASGAAGVPLTPETAAARHQKANSTAAVVRPTYIFGYGSLIERESRMGTWADAKIALPVIVKHVTRGWYDQTDVPSWSPTYLGAVADEGAECNGVIFRVTPAAFGSYTRREIGYIPTKVDPSQITMLDGSVAPPTADIWYFANARKRFPSRDRPIVQSYVDLCLNGCLEIEAMYPLARQAAFAERFIRTTSHWEAPWINDRIFPWRPFIYVPRAFVIDALIQKTLGKEMFERITLR